MWSSSRNGFFRKVRVDSVAVSASMTAESKTLIFASASGKYSPLM